MGNVKTQIAAQIHNRTRASTANAWSDHVTVFTNTSDILISNEHPSWRSQPDGGGPFALVSTRYQVAAGSLNTNVLQGQFVVTSAQQSPSGYGSPVLASDADLTSKGTTAIARSMPTNPAAGLSTALGELRNDGLPHVIGSTAFKEQVRTARKAGDEYLNYEFGWLPLVSDLRKFAHAVKHRDEIMRGYMKYSDKQIRRRYEFPATEASDSSGPWTGYVDFNLNYPVRCYYTDTKKIEDWFSGAFRYHVPQPTDFASKAAYYKAEASKILGLELTPEVVWNLTPWSWAVDWFTNTGDVIHNISRLGNDGLVMRYGYMMHRDVRTRQLVASGYDNYASKGFSSLYRKETAVKQRFKSSPYGFGLTFNGLSNTQKGVIVALGLSRAF